MRSNASAFADISHGLEVSEIYFDDNPFSCSHQNELRGSPMGKHWRQRASILQDQIITCRYGTTGSKMALARSTERYTDCVALT
jgi:hypothetical protein